MGFSANQTRCRAVVRERAEQLDGRFSRIDHQRGPVLQVRAPRPGGEAHVRQGGLRVRAQPAAVLRRRACTNAAGVRAESGRMLNRRSPGCSTGPGAAASRRRLLGRFFEDDVRVGPGEPKRADSRNARPTVAFPGGGLLDNLHRKPVPGNVRRRVLKVEVLRQ